MVIRAINQDPEAWPDSRPAGSHQGESAFPSDRKGLDAEATVL